LLLLSELQSLGDLYPGIFKARPKNGLLPRRAAAAAVCLLDLLPKFQAAAIYYRCTLMVLQVFHFLRPYLLIVDVLSNNL
jgi:hypothetical protein